jgi:hypothetical protein
MPMDGTLRQVSPETCAGELRGYRVQVFHTGGAWFVAFISPRGHTEAVLPVASLADGARRARVWVEGRVPAPRSPDAAGR